MRFTHHAKNQLRRNEWTQAEVLSVIAEPVTVDFDPAGRRRYLGFIRGEAARVVVAADDPEVVITVHPRRRA